jgi:hypothetical protein
MDGSDYAGQTAFQSMGLFGWLVILAIYAFLGWTMYRIARKTGCVSSAWWAWVPILNAFLVIKCAAKPWWWFFLLCIPIVNIVFAVMLWMEIAKACGQPSWWGFVMLLPVVNFFVMAYLAFAGPAPISKEFPTQTPVQPRHPEKVI